MLFLTAKDAVEDRIAGLTAGGDDYVTKPFSLEVIRGCEVWWRAGLVAVREDARLVVGDLELDEDSHEVRRDGTIVALTATEFELLRFHAQPASCSQGADPRPVWNYTSGQANIVELYLLPPQEDRRRPAPMIHTMRGAGYVLKPAESSR